MVHYIIVYWRARRLQKSRRPYKSTVAILAQGTQRVQAYCSPGFDPRSAPRARPRKGRARDREREGGADMYPSPTLPRWLTKTSPEGLLSELRKSRAESPEALGGKRWERVLGLDINTVMILI